MKPPLIVYLCSSALIFAFLAYSVFHEIPAMDYLGFFLLLPGYFLASFVFWGGIHSDYGEAWLWLALVVNALLWGIPLSLAVNYLRKRIFRNELRK